MRSYRRRSQATRAAAPRGAIRGGAIRIATTSPPAARSRAALLGSIWLGALAMFAPNAAQATDGTWIGNGAPVSNEWFQGNNWNSTPTPNTVPDITATFTNNGAPTSVTISNSTSINTIDFTAGAPTYSFTVQTGAVFTINSPITHDSSFAPAFTVNAGSALTVGNGAFVEIGSLAGGGTVMISDSFSLLSIVGNGATTFSGKFSGAGSLELDDTASLPLTGPSHAGNIGSIGGHLTLCP